MIEERKRALCSMKGITLEDFQMGENFLKKHLKGFVFFSSEELDLMDKVTDIHSQLVQEGITTEEDAIKSAEYQLKRHGGSAGALAGPKAISTIEIVHGILQQAMDEVGDRATTYDTPQGEESMPKVVKMFNMLYGYEIAVEHGWMFMALLKAVRSSQGAYKRDTYVDLAAYAAFAGKAAMESQSGQ